MTLSMHEKINHFISHISSFSLSRINNKAIILMDHITLWVSTEMKFEHISDNILIDRARVVHVHTPKATIAMIYTTME